MGFFICNNCGESLKKNIVEKHPFRCRTLQGLSCMDCHKVFGNDFVNHLSCVTEQEKYGGQGFVAKDTKNQKKQEQWVEKLVEAWKKDVSTKSLFSNYFQDSNKWQNIPRNLPKLKNYLNNSLRVHPGHVDKFCQIASRVLESIQRERMEQENNSQTDQNESKRKIENPDESVHSKKLRLEKMSEKVSEINKEITNGVVVSLEEESIKKPKKKVLSNGSINENEVFKISTNKENNSNNNNVDEAGENGNLSKFKWKSSIKNTLRTHNSKMKIKKLQKIIVRQYLSCNGNEDCAEEAKELFQKKINNNKFIILEDKYIQLK